MENKIKQLRKGILELVILGALKEKTHYGYSLIKSITTEEYLSINEGTLYPILARLAKESLVRTEWVESQQGPPRKYYSLTIKGTEILRALTEEFEKLVALVNSVRAVHQNSENHQSQHQKKIMVKKESQQ